MNAVESYIVQFPPLTQEVLNTLRKLVLTHAPDAVEGIAYGMPAYKTYCKPLIYFAAFANHIGLYAIPSGHEVFQSELTPYKQGKGSVQFPLKEPMPYALIERIIQYRVDENRGKYEKFKVNN